MNDYDFGNRNKIQYAIGVGNSNNNNNNNANPNPHNDEDYVPPEVPEELQTKTEKTINYYKFLLHSLKIELKLLEFFNLMRSSSSSEVGLWIFSACLYASIPDTLDIKSKPYVWFHLVHLARGILGFVLVYKLPKTYEFMDSMENDINVTEGKSYNDVLREVGKREIIPRIESNKWLLISYLILTFINLIIDVIDFISSLGNVDPSIPDMNYIYITFTYLVIALIYISNI